MKSLLLLLLIPQIVFGQMNQNPVDFTDGNNNIQFNSNPNSYTGFNSGQMPRNKLNLSFLSNRQSDCSFEPKLSADDFTLLNDAQKAIEALKSNNACAPMLGQIDNFQKAMTAYNSLNGTNRQSGFDGNVQVNCANYEDLYDMEYDYFIDNWNAPGNPMQDPFMQCRQKAQMDMSACGSDPVCLENVHKASLDCGALVTGQSKSSKRYECEKFKTALNQSQRADVVADTYKKGMDALQAILSNDGCIDSAGEQKLSFIQNAVSMAGRAASIGSMGGPYGILIGAATGIVGTVFKKIFDNDSKKKDNLKILENRENFTQIACLYEKLESKGLRCDRIAAHREIENTKKTFDEANNCVEITNKEFIEIDKLMENMTSIISQLSATPTVPAKTINQSTFDVLVENLSKKFPGTNESILQIGEKNALDVDLKLGETIASDEKLAQLFTSFNPKITSPSKAQLRQIKNQLIEQQKRAQSIQKVLNSIASADAKGTSMTEQDLNLVNDAMKGFGSDTQSMSFVSAYNEMLITRVHMLPDGDLSAKIKTYNAKLDEAQVYKAAMSRYQSQEKLSQTAFEDNGNFEDARNGLKPHLEKLLESELNSLHARAKSFKDVKQGLQSTVLKEVLKKGEEEVIFPLLRACNQLQSVMNADRKGTLDPSSQHPACKAFNCPQGNKTFKDYLRSQNVSLDDKDCRSTECRGQYNRYICEERPKLPSIRNNIKNEFENSGTLCGKPLAQAFEE